MKNLAGVILLLMMTRSLCSCNTNKFVSTHELNEFKGNYKKTVLIGIDSSKTKEIKGENYFPIYLTFDYHNQP